MQLETRCEYLLSQNRYPTLVGHTVGSTASKILIFDISINNASTSHSSWSSGKPRFNSGHEPLDTMSTEPSNTDSASKSIEQVDIKASNDSGIATALCISGPEASNGQQDRAGSDPVDVESEIKES